VNFGVVRLSVVVQVDLLDVVGILLDLSVGLFSSSFVLSSMSLVTLN